MSLFKLGFLCLMVLGVSSANAQLKAIRIDGSSTLAVAIRPVAVEFGKAKSVGMTVSTNGAKKAIECLEKKTCHLGIASANSVPAGTALEVIPYGISGLEVVVGKGAGVSKLTTDQIKGIFSGKVKNWKEVGGADLAVMAIRRRDGSGSTRLFEEFAPVSKELKEIETAQGVVNFLKANPGGVTYLNSGTAADPSYVAVAVDGIEPSAENIKSGKYKMQLKYVMMMNKEFSADPLLKELLEQIMKSREKLFAEQGMIMP